MEKGKLYKLLVNLRVEKTSLKVLSDIQIITLYDAIKTIEHDSNMIYRLYYLAASEHLSKENKDKYEESN